MNQMISLNGSNWRLKGFYGEDWLFRKAHLPGDPEQRGWIPATVPGSVQQDLWQAGEVPNPYFERNSLQIEWSAARSWVYQRSFQAGPGWQNPAGTRARLRFKGVDYDAHFFLNGQALGEHHSMYTPVSFEVGPLLNWNADNQIAVVIDTARVEWPQLGYTSRVRTLKARMNYWWDFCPRFVHQGIWDSVDVLISGPAAIEDVWVHPVCEEGGRSARVQTSIEISLLETARVEVTCQITFQGQPVAQQTSIQRLKEGISRVTLESLLDQPELWWPNGFGPQNLYSAEVTARVIDEEDEKHESDRRAVAFGIREIIFVPNEGAASDARPYTLTVNGQRIYIRGWNWVPADALYGVERPARLQHLLGLARNAHVNLLRVWGGGLIEKDSFYDLCDRYGILVWQEFIQSSSGMDNNAPEDPEFVGWVAGEARQIVKGRRNHPSLAIWCGGNELMTADNVPLTDAHPMMAVLKAVVEAQDPGRAWVTTSASGPYASNNLEQARKAPDTLHDVHGPWEYQGLQKQYDLYNGTTSLFHSEFGAEGLTNLRALNAIIAPEHQWPVSLDNPVWMHLAAWWVKEKPWQEFFGELTDLRSVQRATQFTQFEGVRYAIEANRRRSFRNSGSMPWQFNEPYPMASCTSAVDYFGVPKPLYYGARAAYRPLAISARYPTLAWAGRETFEAEAWLAPAEGQPVENARLTWKLVGLDGKVFASATVPAAAPDDHPAQTAQIGCPMEQIEDNLFFLDLQLASAQGQTLAENRYLFTRAANLAPILALPAAQISTEVVHQQDCWEVRLTNTGVIAALYVQLEMETVNSGGWANPDENYFCLLPGETRLARVEWENVPYPQRQVAVWAWNLPEQILSI